MKMLTFSRMAAARLRANKRSYLSLALGIFLSIFLISSMAFGAYGAYLARQQMRYDKVGYMDMVILDNDSFGDEEIQALNQYDRIGHAYILGQAENSSLFVGSYDETAVELLNLTPVSGRLPESAGEIALEATAMDVLEVQWELGDRVELTVKAIDGEAETREFTLVGILPERSTNLEVQEKDGINSFPAIVVSREESSFAVGRVGVNYLLHRKSSVSANAAYESMWKAWQHRIFTFYGLTTSGEQSRIYYGNLSLRTSLDSDLLSMLLMAGLLAGSLVVGCAVGISGAMEGLLMKRREEIGVLRALGATRRQIQRMFGRENLLLAAILAPASIAMSMGAVWIASLIFPSDIKFGFHIGLLLPILVFSVAVILLAGYLPLVRASKLMPMSVIRDTAMLRHGKRVKSKKTFSAPRLMASRQVRFHLSRQIGASLLVGLMLMCSGLLLALAIEYLDYTGYNQAAFILQNERSGFGSDDYVQLYDGESISSRSISQISSLDHVKSLRVNRKMPLIAVVPETPRYAVFGEDHQQIGAMNAELLEASRQFYGDYFDGYVGNHYEEYRAEYQQFLKSNQIDGEAYAMNLVTMEMTGDNVKMLESYLESGKINVDAINAGQEVIIIAPKIWATAYKGGYSCYYSQEAAEESRHQGDVQLLAWNNVFSAGQTLPLMQLYQTVSGGEVIRNDETVTVGAVVTGVNDDNIWTTNNCLILTSEQGLAAMNFLPENVTSVDIYLEGEVSREAEEDLEVQIIAISRRVSSWSVVNMVDIFRQAREEDQQQLLLLVSISLVFFAVAVGMIVSSVTRQLQSEGRTIGMLRAVGADEKAILGCYSGSLRFCIALGLGISLGLVILYLAFFILSYLDAGIRWISSNLVLWGYVVLGCIVMALLCYAACRILLQKRIREIVNRSIIENIREL